MGTHQTYLKRLEGRRKGREKSLGREPLDDRMFRTWGGVHAALFKLGVKRIWDENSSEGQPCQETIRDPSGPREKGRKEKQKKISLYGNGWKSEDFFVCRSGSLVKQEGNPHPKREKQAIHKQGKETVEVEILSLAVGTILGGRENLKKTKGNLVSKGGKGFRQSPCVNKQSGSNRTGKREVICPSNCAERIGETVYQADRGPPPIGGFS